MVKIPLTLLDVLEVLLQWSLEWLLVVGVLVRAVVGVVELGWLLDWSWW